MENYPKILVSAPINKVKQYCIWEYFAIVKNLTYPNYSLYFVDNSKDENFHKEIRAHGIDCDRIAPEGKSSREFMCECNNKIRERVLNGGYDYLLNIECDLYVPLDIIENLLAHNKQVAACVYFIYTGEDSTLMLQEIESINPASSHKETRNVGAIEGFCAFDGTLKSYYACGIGVSLISRNILRDIKFRVGDDSGHSDSFFYQDLYRMGLKPYIDTSIAVHHFNQSWFGIAENYKEFR